MSFSKLRPIYAALDRNQLNKAIKLCQAQPATNAMAQALLAHAYNKSEQRYKALCVIQGLLGTDGFAELQLELKYSLERREQSKLTAAPLPSQSAPAASGKKSKKSKKSAASASAPPPTAFVTSIADDYTDWDLVEQLDDPPQLPPDWDRLPGSDCLAPTDHVVIKNLVLTLQQLMLPLTAHQLYAWAAQRTGESIYLLKAFTIGVACTASPKYYDQPNIVIPLLGHLQVMALQLAKIQQDRYGVSPATAWAAQTALWQVEALQQNPSVASSTSGIMDQATYQQKLVMLPRLAESLALKCLASETLTTPDEVTVAIEVYWLYLRSLDVQSKNEEKLASLTDRLMRHEVPPAQDLRDALLDALIKDEQWDDALAVLDDLLRDFPDDWSYWTHHMKCSVNATGNDAEGMQRTLDAVEIVQMGYSNPIRALHLLRVDMVAQRLSSDSADGLDDLYDQIATYGATFGAVSLCAFEDLRPYIDTFLRHAKADDLIGVLDRLHAVEHPSSCKVTDRRAELRQFIFAVKFQHQILAKHSNLESVSSLSWQSLIQVWKDFQEFDAPDQVQTESRPADDLVLLAVQKLLASDREATREQRYFLAAALLENAIEYSPYNAYLAIAALQVYDQLDAAARAFQLYNTLSIKHIQHQSCTYLILPILRAAGFHVELVGICQEILRLQRKATAEVNEYVGKALENGVLSKASEFLDFHCRRTNNSLTTLEVKGLILNSAPFYKLDNDTAQEIGSVHGIVGGALDVEHAHKMIASIHDPVAACDIMQRHFLRAMNGGASNDGSDKMRYSDNRDASIVDFNILSPTAIPAASTIVHDTRMRGLFHKLLLLSTLCVDAAKPLKKGKLVSANTDLMKRCRRLLSAAHSESDMEHVSSTSMHADFLPILTCFCDVIAILAAGLVWNVASDEGEVDLNDSLEHRCTGAAVQLDRVAELLHYVVRRKLQEMSMRDVNELLPDCLLAIITLLLLNGKMMELCGWTKWARNVDRSCCVALTRVYETMQNLLTQLESQVACPATAPLILVPELRTDLVPLVLTEIALSEVSLVVSKSRELSRTRCLAILGEMKERLKIVG